ncbi:branched-chain amino acid aminotransferase II [Wallemia mellicola]|nr:branched-chain amino acid aminotransferase II [Wallemia mellicola]
MNIAQNIAKSPSVAANSMKAAYSTAAPSSKIYRDAMTGEVTSLPDIDVRWKVSKLQIEKIANPKTIPPSNTLRFGHTFSDHMLIIPWNSGSGWGAPTIKPYGPLTLDPSAVCFHYAPQLFEGMKAYRDSEGNVRLFRPDMNMTRMNRTAERAALPTFDGQSMVELIRRLVVLDQNWIPQEPGYSLYIRPTLIGTQASLGVGASSDALLYVICSPVGPYFKNGFKPVKLLATSKNVRAWPGGTGAFKLGANYVQGVKPQHEAAEKGYDQNLWLFGEGEELTEVGTMNLFIVVRNDAGETELITPPLGDMILPGVVRDSILNLARDPPEWLKEQLPENFKVTERRITMPELAKLAEEGRVVESFGSGTACIIASISCVNWREKDITIPVEADGSGAIATVLRNAIEAVQLGREEHPWSIVC